MAPLPSSALGDTSHSSTRQNGPDTTTAVAALTSFKPAPQPWSRMPIPRARKPEPGLPSGTLPALGHGGRSGPSTRHPALRVLAAEERYVQRVGSWAVSQRQGITPWPRAENGPISVGRLLDPLSHRARSVLRFIVGPSWPSGRRTSAAQSGNITWKRPPDLSVAAGPNNKEPSSCHRHDD